MAGDEVFRGDEAFRHEIRDWLAANLTDDLRGAGGPGRENDAFPQRLAFTRKLAAAGWATLAWPVGHGGRGASLAQQVIFHEEYARSGAPSRADHIGTTMVGPTLMDLGTPAQQQRFLPALKSVDELWCQGYSEPGAGSDLAGVTTRAELDGDQWVITGQKVWTSLAHVADWCFVLARTSPPDGGPRHRGLSYLLVPMRQPGVTVRPIRQITGDSEFNEVFFDGARTARDLVVGRPGEGWRVAMATLAYERGAATVGQQIGFQRDLDDLVDLARRTGAAGDQLLRIRLARASVDLTVLRSHTLRTLSAAVPPTAFPSVVKLLWTRWRQSLGELAMDVLQFGGASGEETERWQRLFLFSRADTIYGGSNEIQRGIVAERVLGLPRGARR